MFFVCWFCCLADVLGHRYGDDVGAASKDVMSVAYDVYVQRVCFVVSFNFGVFVSCRGAAKVALGKIGVKSIAKRAAAGTALQLASSEEENQDRQAQAPHINPMIGASALMVSNQLAQQYDASGGLLKKEKPAQS